MTSLFVEFTEPAEAEISAAVEYARAGDYHVERFTQRVAEAFDEAALQLAEEIDANESGKPFMRTDEAASVRWSQPVYRLNIETAGKRRRGSSAGLWYAYYCLQSRAGTEKPDTMIILAFRHSAARPLSVDDEENADQG